MDLKKTIATMVLAFAGVPVFAQDDMTIDQPFFGLPAYYQTQTIEIDSLGQLPTKIQFIAQAVIKNSMTDFVDNIKFVKGQVIDLDNWLTKDSLTQTAYLGPVPKYQLYFELRDMALNIKVYCFELSLDSYGQVLDLEWPRTEYNKSTDFVNSKLVKAKAEKFAMAKGYRTDVLIKELKYDNELNKMCWQISFLQKSTGDSFTYWREYKTIVLDATSLTILKESDMFSRGID